jgi:hypothetical protein
MYNVCTCIYTVCTGVYAMYIHVVTSCLNADLSGHFGGISLYVHNGRFLYDSIVHTYVKGSTTEYAVANTTLVYAYNMW